MRPRVLFTGERFFLTRHRHLLDAARVYADVDVLAVQDRRPLERAAFAASVGTFALGAVLRRPGSLASRLDPRALKLAYAKSPTSFVAKSRQIENGIARRAPRPDAVVHVFGLSSPFTADSPIPYAHYLDYTYALALRTNPDEVPAFDRRERERWLACERATYARATRLFPMSELVRRSLVDDYGVDPAKIVVAGSGGNFTEPSTAPKTFGSRRLLFNASDFTRKGGDAVLAAFRRVRELDPSVTLTTVGRPLPSRVTVPEGVTDRGPVPGPEMRRLLADADVVLAPARSDPFPGFVIEALDAGTPCIVSDRDGMPELVSDGIDGVVVPPDDPARLADATFALLGDRDRLEAFSVAGRRKVAARLNWDAVAAIMAPFLRGDPTGRRSAARA